MTWSAPKLRGVHCALVAASFLLIVLAVDAALTKLSKLDPRKERAFELRFFGGLSLEEAAQVLRVSPATATRDYRMAKAWLAREIGAIT